MTLQSIFESYQAYWPAVFLFIPMGRYFQVLFFMTVWDGKTDSIRRPNTWEAVVITVKTIDVMIVQLLITGILIAAILWVAPFFTDQMI